MHADTPAAVACMCTHLALQVLVVQVVQDASAEGSGLAGTGLGLLDHIQTLGEGHNTLLLDSRGLLETCSSTAWAALFNT
jgi:hypothetical protein